ncbi:MAG: hypothetical protein Q8O67_16350 [Deltaproteobacteria bacterium]|nr:hypothetical protein [Deltaproteobacteria bacterium]
MTREPRSVVDQRLRLAFGRLDHLAHRRVASVGAGAGQAAAVVVEHAAARVEDRVRTALWGSAWVVVGVAFGLGLLFGYRSVPSSFHPGEPR